MKVTIVFESNKQDDGVESISSYSRDEVETLNDLAWVYSEAARVGGYTYVDRVCIAEDKEEYWSLA